MTTVYPRLLRLISQRSLFLFVLSVYSERVEKERMGRARVGLVREGELMFQLLLFLRLNDNLISVEKKSSGLGELWPHSYLEEGDGEEEKARPLGLRLHGGSAL